MLLFSHKFGYWFETVSQLNVETNTHIQYQSLKKKGGQQLCQINKNNEKKTHTQHIALNKRLKCKREKCNVTKCIILKFELQSNANASCATSIRCIFVNFFLVFFYCCCIVVCSPLPFRRQRLFVSFEHKTK